MVHKLSIIIPAYNCSQYIGDCLNSIFLQRDAPQHQVIVVDDGSTDGTADIVRKYALLFPNIELISQKNAGVSVARNAGLDAARGEYVTFIDADDMVGLDAALIQHMVQYPIHRTNIKNVFNAVYKMPENMGRLRFEDTYFERMLNTAYKYDADMVMGSCFTVDPTIGAIGYYSYDKLAPDIVAAEDEDIFRLLAINQCSSMDNANYQLYRREMLDRHDLRFTPGMQLNEDLLFAMQAALRANSIRTAGDSTYLYRRHNGSLSNINGRFPSVDKIWRTQVYISAVILSDLRKLGYKRAYNLFQKQQTYAFDALGYNGADREDVITCDRYVKYCYCPSCENCEYDAIILTQIKKNLVKYKPKTR